jgi:hypothetical protein
MGSPWWRRVVRKCSFLLRARSTARATMSQRLKPVYGWVVIVRAKARTYLRSNSNGENNDNGKNNSNGKCNDKYRDPSLRSRMTA